MKFLLDLEDKELLPRTMDLSKSLNAFIGITGLKNITVTPKDGETVKHAMSRSLGETLNVLFRQYPTETGELLRQFWIPEAEGEVFPNALVTMCVLMGRKDLVPFVTSLLTFSLQQ